ncbi:VanZ family protein [Streptomyces sp. cmx-18-6]|uniref:VanZ family protein n=1 Tax=Streptomyces sp. cmx-18-6 TaxID=2790930 RepID=UPI003980B422
MTSEAKARTGQGTWARVLLRVTVLTVVLLGLVVFSIFLAKVTLTPSPASADIVTSNLRPGRSLRQYAEDYTFLAACKQAGGNVLLGVPFGLLLPFLVPRRLRVVSMTLLTAAAMIVVELIQGALVTGRAFDIDDVILNTAGALLGYFLLGRRISHRYHAFAHPPRAGAAGPGTGPEPTDATTDGKPAPRSRTKAGAKAGTESGAKAGTEDAPPSRADRTRTKPRATAASGTGASAKRATGSGGRGADGGAPPGVGRPLLDRLRRR